MLKHFPCFCPSLISMSINKTILINGLIKSSTWLVLQKELIVKDFLPILPSIQHHPCNMEPLGLLRMEFCQEWYNLSIFATIIFCLLLFPDKKEMLIRLQILLQIADMKNVIEWIGHNSVLTTKANKKFNSSNNISTHAGMFNTHFILF